MLLLVNQLWKTSHAWLKSHSSQAAEAVHGCIFQYSLILDETMKLSHVGNLPLLSIDIPARIFSHPEAMMWMNS
jgi:hypothetical protein